MFRKFHTALALTLAIGLSSAPLASAAGGGAGAVRKQVVASMVVTGEIAIDERGYVVSHQIYQADKVPPGVVNLFGSAVPQWRFEPVVMDGVARPARSKMRVRVVARKLDDGDYVITFKDADFRGNEPAPEPGSFPTARDMLHPAYPEAAARNRAGAAVFVVIKVGPTGMVEEAAVEQVNLPFYGPERVMDSYRKLFGDTALRAAKRSTFNPPTVGELAGTSTTVRVPYVFQGDGGPLVDAPYGQWVSYVPGPYQPAPWRVMERSGSPDLMATHGGPEPLTNARGLRLLTALGDGG